MTNWQEGGELVETSVNILEKNIDIRGLWREGFRRDPSKYYFATTYPPVTLAKGMSEQDVFADFKTKNEKVALYFHIPFCSRRCTFCHYYSVTASSYDDIDQYLVYLKNEARIARKYLGNNSQIDAVYIGGGTPTVLRPDQIGDLFAFVHNEFTLSPAAEVTVEVHPEIVRSDLKGYLRILRKSGVNRISIGVQTFEDSILEVIHRGHSSGESIRLLDEVRNADFPCVVIDLLIGLPDQTIGSWLKDLETAYQLEPDVVTTYCMAIRDWTANYQWYKRETHRFPNEYLVHLLYIMGSEKAKHEGYVQNPPMYYSTIDDHFKYATEVFGKPEEGIVIGLGVSAYSWVNACQYFNHNSFREYFRCISQGNLPISKGLKLPLNDRMARMVMLNLRFSSSIEKKHFNVVFGREIGEIYGETINRLVKLGLLREHDGTLSLTYSGALFADELCTLFVPTSTRNKLKRLKGKFDRFYRV